MFLAIDPGIKTGWARFRADGLLIAAGLGDPRLPGITHLLIECPQIYTAARSKGDPNDILKLAIRVGQYVEFYRLQGVNAEMVTPAQWKGQTPKNIHARRVHGSLSEAEQETLVRDLMPISCAKPTIPAAFNHRAAWERDDRNNVFDAVGLGLWNLKRLKR